MCMLVFLAASEPLSLVPWDPDQPAFHVRDLADDREFAVKEHLQYPNVYYTGSREKCGCGFSFGIDPEWEDEEDVIANRASASMLAEYLDAAIAANVSLELFACEAGGESRSPQLQRTITTDSLRAKRFWFQDGEVVKVTNGTA